MGDLLTATLGGSVATALAVGGRALGIPGSVRANDADAEERNESLETWVADRHYYLGLELRGVRTTMHAQGQGNAGAIDNAIAAAKAQALHEYRDEERRARRDVALIRAREGWMHRAWRNVTRLPPSTLTAADRAAPVLDTWRRASNENADARPTPVEDATSRTIDDTIGNLTGTSP